MAPLADVKSVVAACDAVTHFLTLRALARERGEAWPLPPQLEQIAELAAALPAPEPAARAAVALGALPSKAAAKAAGGTTPGRARWSEESIAELVRLVDDPAHRAAALGGMGDRGGHVNWSALARHMKFAGTEPLRRQYQAATGREPPTAPRPPKREAGAEGGEGGAAKKPKAAPKAAAAAAAAAAAGAAGAGASDGWSPADCEALVKMATDEAYRKERTGKKHLKWSRIGEALGGRTKKEARKKYTVLTGLPPPE
jgi:hypothetical protein